MTKGLMQAALGALALAAAAMPLAAAAQDGQPAASTPATGDCTVTTNVSPELDVLLQANGLALADYDTFCARLAEVRMGVEANGYAMVEGDNTSAVVVMRLHDAATFTGSAEMTFGFNIAPGTDDAARQAALLGAFNLASSGIEEDMTRYIASVVDEMARLDGLYRAGVARAVVPVEDPCLVTFRSMPLIEQAINARAALPEFAGYDTFCAALAEHGAGLEFMGGQMSVGDEQHTFVGLSVYDLATGVPGNYQGFALAWTREAIAEDVADNLWLALQAGLQGMAEESETVFRSLDNVLERNRRNYPVGGS